MQKQELAQAENRYTRKSQSPKKKSKARRQSWSRSKVQAAKKKKNPVFSNIINDNHKKYLRKPLNRL